MACFRGVREKPLEEEISTTLKCTDTFSFSPRIIPAAATRSKFLKASSAKFWGSPSVDKAAQPTLYHSAPLPTEFRDLGLPASNFRRSGPICHSTGHAFGGPPLPLPLPAPKNARSVAPKPAVASNGNGTEAWKPCAAEPKPLPPPKEQLAALRAFSWEELAAACNNFSPKFFSRDGGAGPVYRAFLSKTAVDITRISSPPSQSVRKWVTELRSVGRLQHPHLCRVVGFYVHISLPDAKPKPSCEQVVVYASMPNGSLDGLLYGRPANKPPLDWPSRVKIAFGAARGLAFLHEISPVQVAYRCFQTMNVQVDRDFNARLSDYCFARMPPTNPDVATRSEAYLAPETVRDRHVFPKSNVWGFGVVLLELLTGRQNMDTLFPDEERDLVTFCRPFIEEEGKLYMIMDPELKGFYPTKMARKIAGLALRCLEEDVVQRPSMKDVENALRAVHNAGRLAKTKAGEEKMVVDKLAVVVYQENRTHGSSVHSCRDSMTKDHTFAAACNKPVVDYPHQ